jgi:ABC-type bacteriocin/lantibiotic exporter with double-glycine peptidase domain
MYDEWDPEAYGSITIDELIASLPIKISKQTFYTEAARRNVTLKSHQAPDQVKAQVEAMLEALVTARVRVRLLEQTLNQHGIPLP